MASDLRTEAVRGAGWTAVQKWAVRVSGLLVFVVLSRLLGPAAIGIAAAALALTSLLSAPLELGVRSFLVRSGAGEVKAENSVFWCAVGASVVGIALSCGAAELIRRLDGPEQLWQILIALSPIVLVTAVEAVPSARLERDLKFRSLAVREMISAVCAGAVGVSLAAAGAGVWSLVAQAHVQALVSLLLVVKFARWRPGFSFDRPVAGQFLRFGGPLIGVQLTQLLRDRVDQLLIGAILGLDVLGFWSIATRMLSAVEDLSISLLDVVAYPVFVRIQGDRTRLTRAYEVALSTCQSVLVPILAVVAVTAPYLVPAVFGPQWIPAVLPTQILCLAYAIYGLAFLYRPMIRSAGRAGTEFGFVIVNQVMHFGVLVIAAPHGLTVISIVLAFEAVASVALGAWLLATKVGVPSPLPRQALLTMVYGSAAAACGLQVAAWRGAETLSTALLAAAVTIAVFALGMLLFSRQLLIGIVEDAGRMVRRRA
jgi:O-antigen/teichoic acid export membrane protein